MVHPAEVVPAGIRRRAGDPRLGTLAGPGEAPRIQQGLRPRPLARVVGLRVRSARRHRLPHVRRPVLGADLAKIERLPSVGKGPIEEWYRAIKGEGPAPGSNFEYSSRLTEMVLLGALAQRTGKTIEWDAANMKVKGQPELDALLKEPAVEGWRYGETL